MAGSLLLIGRRECRIESLRRQGLGRIEDVFQLDLKGVEQRESIRSTIARISSSLLFCKETGTICKYFVAIAGEKRRMPSLRRLDH